MVRARLRAQVRALVRAPCHITAMRIVPCLIALAMVLCACSGSEAERAEHPVAVEPTAPDPTPSPSVEPTAEGGDEASATGALCGTRGAGECPTGTYCDFGPASNCGADDRGGHCAPIPEMCTREFMPVCGCDGATHATACVAHSAGVSVAHDGPC